jgi:DNA-binding MarR family transcriptional regulator
MATEREVVDSCVCHKVRMAARAVTRAYDAALRPVGLRATQFAVLVAVATEEALSITALAQALGMDRSTLTRNVRPLVKDELLVVGREGWHRSRTVEITERGRARVREALPLWARAQARLQRQLGEPQWASVHQSLEALGRMA